MIKGVLLTSLGYAAIISVGEFGASTFLAYGSEGTIPTLLFRLIARPGEQNYGMAMAVSALLAGFIASVLILLEARVGEARSEVSKHNTLMGPIVFR
jgi:thiamine transport system permease protein